jgi:hypothetical protein
MKYLLIILVGFLTITLSAQKNQIDFQTTNFLAYRYSVNLKPNKFVSYDSLKSNIILFTSKKINAKKNIEFLRLKQVLEEQRIITNIVIYNVYWDGGNAGPTAACNTEPNLIFNNQTWTPNKLQIDSMKSLNPESFFVYTDTCSGDFRQNNNLIAPYLQSLGSKSKERIIPVLRYEEFLDMLHIFGQVSKRINQLNDTIIKNNLLLRNQLEIVQRSTAKAKSFSIGLRDQISFQDGTNYSVTNINYNLSNFKSNSFGISSNYHYTLNKKSKANDDGNATSIVFGFSYLKNNSSFMLSSGQSTTDLLANNIRDSYGDLYNRFITIKQLSESISVQSNRFLVDLDLNRQYKKDNCLIGWIIGFTAGSDLGAKVNYHLNNSEVYYYGKYPQYNNNDTMFNNIDDFGKRFSLNNQESAFRNAGNATFYGGNLGFVLRIKDISFDIKASYIHTMSTYSNASIGSELPLFSNMPYNSVLLRTNYLKYNTIALNFGVKYFL